MVLQIIHFTYAGVLKLDNCNFPDGLHKFQKTRPNTARRNIIQTNANISVIMFADDSHDLFCRMAHISRSVSPAKSFEPSSTISPKAKVIEVVKVFCVNILYIMFSLLCCCQYYTFGMFLVPFL